MNKWNVYSSIQGCTFILDFAITFSILQFGFLVSGLLGTRKTAIICTNVFLEIFMYKLNTSVFLLNWLDVEGKVISVCNSQVGKHGCKIWVLKRGVLTQEKDRKLITKVLNSFSNYYYKSHLPRDNQEN